MFCNGCGKPNPDDAAFCSSCGARQGTPVAPAPTWTPPASTLEGWKAASAQSRAASPKSSSGTRVLLWILGIGLAGTLLLGGLAVFGVRFAMAIFAEQVRVELQDNPVLRAHLGEPEKFELDWVGTGADSREDVYVFRVRGTQGRGRVSAACVTVDADREQVTSGSLRLESGEEYDLFPEGEEVEEAGVEE
jgi:hypothetical protein